MKKPLDKIMPKGLIYLLMKTKYTSNLHQKPQQSNTLLPGTKRYFVGSTEISKPVNHGYPQFIWETLLEQSGHITKEWNRNEWKIIPNI